MSKLFSRASVAGASLSGANLKATLTALWDALSSAGLTDVARTTVTASATLLTTQCGTLLVDATAGNVVLTLPASGPAIDDATYNVRRLDSTANTVTIQRAGTDTIEGGASVTVGSLGLLGLTLPAGATVWRVLNISGATPAAVRASIGLTNERAFINRIINGGFTINQRVYVSGTALAAGIYAHDRWKAGAGGGTYTFAQPAAGVPCAITITAGTFQQVIEGCNMPEGGSYTLQWPGTAQARVNGGAYGASPLTVAGLVAGANATVEFNAGTITGAVQFEAGAIASPIDYRSIAMELSLCQRYFYIHRASTGYEWFAAVMGTSATAYQGGIVFPVTMRAAPTVINGGTGAFNVWTTSGSATPVSSLSFSAVNPSGCSFGGNAASLAIGSASALLADSGGTSFIQASAEL